MNPKYKLFETVWFFDPWTSIWPVKGVIHQQPHVLKNGVILYHIFSDKYKNFTKEEKECYPSLWKVILLFWKRF